MIDIDINGISESLNDKADIELLEGKADIDLGNIDSTGTASIAHYAMPSDRVIFLTLGESKTHYTMPSDGYICCRATSTADNQYLQVLNNTTQLQMLSRSAGTSGIVCCFIPVRKNDDVYIEYTLGSLTNSFLKFIYAEGSY